mmetsp:Transcript_15005/g.26311  ORF Transcript_15005/g.26311 Transcript_15005/m.26311 type:complete len:557 (+) Transcript_15005:272-1942(+)
MDELGSHPRFGNESAYKVLPLHSGVSTANQREVFKRAGNNVRKIICSTNIAETSVTIDDVVYVIDAGTSKTKRYDPHTKVASLTTKPIAKANAIQRSGRAGRCRPGVCFRLYSQARFEAMIDEEAPEMQRMALEELCLQTCVLLEQNRFVMKRSLNDRRVSVRDFLGHAPDPPQDLCIRNALLLLHAIGAIDSGERLTCVGHALAKLPLDPRLGKMVLIGTLFGAKEQALTLSAFFSTGRDPFIIPITDHDKSMFKRARQTLTNGVGSDHYACVKAYEVWIRDGHKACRKYFLNPAVMNTVKQTRRQIENLITYLPGISLEGHNFSTLTLVEVLACVGAYPNVALLHPGMKKMISGVERNIIPHKTSVMQNLNNGSRHMWVVFDEMIRSKRFCSIRGCTQVGPLFVALFEGSFTIEHVPADADLDKDAITRIHLSDWLELDGGKLETVLGLGILRSRFEKLFTSLLQQNNQNLSTNDYDTVFTILGICEAEKTGMTMKLARNQQPQRNDRATNGAGLKKKKNTKPAPKPSKEKRPDLVRKKSGGGSSRQISQRHQK